MAKAKDYYEFLGVSRTATADQVRAAYRKLARQHHPDVNKAPDAARRFAEIQQAYEVLSDTEKRRAYDQFGEAGVGGVGAGSPPGGAGWGGGGYGRPGRGQRSTWTRAEPGAFGAEDLGGIFEEIFGNRAGRGPSPFGAEAQRGQAAPPQQRGPDIENALTVSFVTAALGGVEQIRFTLDGTTQTINVKIPPGTESGAKLRIKGRGQPGPFGGPPGDLILTVEVGRHPYFRREGLDLLIDVPITIAEAVLGATVRVPLLVAGEGGKWVQIKVPPGASSGRKMRVRGKGMSNAAGKTGDYYAVIQIAAPPAGELTEAGRKSIAELASELKNPRESAPYADELREHSA